jgi:hypothetical protein
LNVSYLGPNVDRGTLTRKKIRLGKGKQKDIGMEVEDKPGDVREKGKQKDDEMEMENEPGNERETQDEGWEIFATDPGLRWLKRQCK